MKTLLLIDATACIYRAYHIPNLKPLQTTDGFPTGAIYGFIHILKNLVIKQCPADYVVCVFDAKGQTFRHELLPEYKAHRDKSDTENLYPQIEPIQAITRALGFPVFIETGVEADDVIATVSTWAVDAGMQVVIASEDKDLCQLVQAQVKIFKPIADQWLDEAGVFEKYGVHPHQMVDFLTLTGDNSDNVQGVEKVGKITAAKWLKTYGTLEAIMEAAPSIKGVVGNNLRNALGYLPLSKQLISLIHDVHLKQMRPLSWENLVIQPADLGLLKSYYDQYQITKRWFPEHANAPSPSRIEEAASHPSAETDKSRYEIVLTEAALADWIKRLEAAEWVGLDTETTGLDVFSASLVGLSLAIRGGVACYIPVGHQQGLEEAPQLPIKTVLETLKPWLEDATRLKIGQNLKFDRHILSRYGIQLAGRCEDTLLMSYVLASHERHGLDILAKRHLGLDSISYESLVGKGVKQKTFDHVPIEQAAVYAAEDADLVVQLYPVLQTALNTIPSLATVYRTLEQPLAAVLWKMEQHGILIDVPKLQAHSLILGARLAILEEEAYTLAGQRFNLNSPKQLQEVLFNPETGLGLSTKGIKKTASGGYSTDESVLEKLAEDYPLPKCLLDYRSLAKLRSTYTDKLPRMVNPQTGRVHTHFGQTGTITGRLSSSEPNLQNIPIRTEEGRKIREAFIAPEGSVLMSADYSQIELRIMAHLSGDAGLVKAFQQGGDVHRRTAAEVAGIAVEEVTPDQRRLAKAINFGLIYGMSAFGVAKQLNVSREAAQTYIDRYFTQYPGVADYMEKTRQEALEQGWVETLFGRRLHLPALKSLNALQKKAAERAAINAPMQGTAADLIKRAMLAVDAFLTQEALQTKLLLQVHDELILEVPEAEIDILQAALPSLMTGVATLSVPLLVEVGIGKSWGEAH